MKYAYFAQDELPGDGGEAKERNALRREQARIAAWHATFNAALTAFAGSIFSARETANEVHGKID